jgi:hypothetical protein
MLHPNGLAVTAVTHDNAESSVFDERRAELDHVRSM